MKWVKQMTKFDQIWLKFKSFILKNLCWPFKDEFWKLSEILTYFSSLKTFVLFLNWFVWTFLIRICLKYWFDQIDIFIQSISYSFKNHGRRKHRRANQENEGGHPKLGQAKSTLHRRKGWGISWHRKSIHHQGLKVKHWPRVFQFHQTIKGKSQNVILILISVKSLQSSTSKE